jgi:hypothetical protein
MFRTTEMAMAGGQHDNMRGRAGIAAELRRQGIGAAMKEAAGKYLQVVDGSVPLGDAGFSTIAGVANREMLREVAQGAAGAATGSSSKTARPPTPSAWCPAPGPPARAIRPAIPAPARPR